MDNTPENIKKSMLGKFVKQGRDVEVDGRETVELQNIFYEYKPVNLLSYDELGLHLLPAPVKEEEDERHFIITESYNWFEAFEQEVHCRRACFANSYDGNDNHCLSYFHYTIRDNELDLFVYVRSMNFDTNFLYDNQTFQLAYFSLFEILLKTYPNLQRGTIKVLNFSLHRYI